MQHNYLDLIYHVWLSQMKIRLGISYQYVIILLLALLSDTVAVTLKDFPEYVHRMQRNDYGKKCMLANEYEVSKNLLLKTLENNFYPLLCRALIRSPNQLAMWRVSFITKLIIDSRTYTHVSMSIVKLIDVVILLLPTLHVDDESRVCLSDIPGELGSDYINASFITVRASL